MAAMESIARLVKELPEDYEEECVKQGALERRRGVSSPGDLMILSMYHLNNGCSLVEISQIAEITKLGKMSDVAFMKRFEKCGNWFKAINEKIVKESLVEYKKPKWLEGKTVIAVDASDITEKGRSGRTYRLHYALDIFKMTSVTYKITDNTVGESLCNFDLKPGNLAFGDRAYASINGIIHCMESGAEYIIRLRKNSFTTRDEQGEKIDLPLRLSELEPSEYLDLKAYATNTHGKKVPVRICAIRKTPEAIKETQKKLKRRESRRQLGISEDAKTFNEYIVLVTNVDERATAEEILEAYRLRWQIEMYFKRLKTIFDFGDLPKRREDSVIAWLNGKIMIALLIEKMIAKATFPPQDITETEYMA